MAIPDTALPAGRIPAIPLRHSRWHRPSCSPLEDRCLLSVVLTDTAPAVPYVGSPVVWTAKSHGLGSKPVYQFSVGPWVVPSKSCVPSLKKTALPGTPCSRGTT